MFDLNDDGLIDIEEFKKTLPAPKASAMTSSVAPQRFASRIGGIQKESKSIVDLTADKYNDGVKGGAEEVIHKDTLTWKKII